MELTTRRRRALSTALALFLAIESVSAVGAAAVTTRPVQGAQEAVPAARVTTTAPVAVAAALVAPTQHPPRDLADGPRQGPARSTEAPAVTKRATTPAAAASALSKPKPAPKPKTPSSAKATTSSAPAAPRTFKGKNHFWFPSLGINRSVAWFPCSRTRDPDNLVYRWGCAGANNVYLLGHAWGVFKPLHDAYVNGRLRVGMKAYYADSRGRTHVYKIKWWKLTRPTTAASWAWAAQSVPSMTLQTCIGANSEYRLMVRLVEVR